MRIDGQHNKECFHSLADKNEILNCVFSLTQLRTCTKNQPLTTKIASIGNDGMITHEG